MFLVHRVPPALRGTVTRIVAYDERALAVVRRPRVVLLSVLTAFALLAEASVAVVFGRNWQLSWWEWHLLMALAFAFIAYSAWVQFRREGSGGGLFDAVALDGIDGGNGFKTELVARTIVATLRELTAGGAS